MNTTTNALVAEQHVADLRRAAERRLATRSESVDRYASRVELRLADAGDAHVVRRLAELDSAGELEGPVLLALLDGEAVAGLSLSDRRVVANPFVPGHQAVALLRLRAEHLSSAPVRRRRLRRLLRLRVA
jgi:hypothetical protein